MRQRRQGVKTKTAINIFEKKVAWSVVEVLGKSTGDEMRG